MAMDVMISQVTQIKPTHDRTPRYFSETMTLSLVLGSGDHMTLHIAPGSEAAVAADLEALAARIRAVAASGQQNAA